MTRVLITIDTELSAGLYQRGVTASANLDRTVLGRCAAGAVGIGWLMDRMDDHAVKGSFFVDPLPALVYGHGIVADMVGPILARGHEVQLHVHSEWLEWAKSAPVGGRRGRNIGDFSEDDQVELLGLAIDLLVAGGAPRPIAFRAGNYGADDRTLAALARLGLAWDTSFNPASPGGHCRIGLPAEAVFPVARAGLIELPVAAILDRPGHIRPAQLCALSGDEMEQALRHAADERHPTFVIVTHSFEMLSRDGQRPNRLVMARFERLCRVIAEDQRLQSAVFADLDTSIALPDAAGPRLAPSLPRTARRVAEQAIGALLYERQIGG